MGINRACSPYKQELSRDLNVFHLTAFGMNYMLPFGIAIIFGFLTKESGKTVALPVLIAFVTMLFTANSYIYMVKKNPVAGSLYSYVDAIFGRKIGFLAGWVLILDYILVPTAVAVSAVYYLSHYFPAINFHILLLGYILVTGLINLLGIRLLANVGLVLLAIAELLLILCLVVFSRHILELKQSLFSLAAFSFSSWHSLFIASTLAVFGYLGYDAISTLAEEAKNPKRDIPRAILLSVVLSTATMFLLGYFAVLSSPDLAAHFANGEWVNNAFFYVVQDAGGQLMSAVFTAGIIMAMVVFNIVSTAAGSRLLYGMGRDRVLPRSFFGKVNKKFKTPHFNILLIMAIELVIGSSSTLDVVANLINFGAIVAFLMLNLAVLCHLFQQKNTDSWFKKLFSLSPPFLGVVTMAVMIGLMQKITLLVGGLWVLIGVIYVSYNKYLRTQVNNDYGAKLIKPSEHINNLNNIVLLAADIKSNLLSDLKNCLEFEHWNTSKALLECVLATDAGGLLLLCRQDEFAGSILAYNYDAEYAYFGLYYIRPELRDENLGCFLTGAALARWGKRKVACDALLMQVDIYARIGFQAMYENRRYIFNTPEVAQTDSLDHLRSCSELTHIVGLSSCNFNAVVDYDAEHFYTRRAKLLEFWLQATEGLAFAYLDDQQQIKGIIAITPAPDNYRIGPFFADEPKIAELLLYKAALLLPDNLCSIDMPLVNPNIRSLIRNFNLVEGNMKSVRMHKGHMNINNLDQVYGHLSIELG